MRLTNHPEEQSAPHSRDYREQEEYAPWWHTAAVLLLLGATSLAGVFQHGLPHLNVPGLNLRLSGYLTVITVEWLIVLLIWRSLRERGYSLGSVRAESWSGWKAPLRDFGFALLFLLVGIPTTSALAFLLPNNSNVLPLLFPTTALEATVWVALGLTAGFCEELIFRGYLLHQFRRWTRSKFLAIGLQGVVFGLAHGYQGWFMLVIAFYGCMFGALAVWRKSVRPGMLAHGLQDTAGGLIYFFMR